ncbi:MAG TPA: serine/threonine-protein kinase [Gemmataceae bacterium]|nr:serine/threonine-protein kinase [Gemmataceae bacterium]
MVGRIFLGRYETVRLLGEGGMGRVYLARQIDLGRQVVVKVMHDHIAADPKFRDRFQRETLLMARFQHPYVVTLYDASLNDPEGPCIVMEYIRGITLDTLLHRNTRLGAPRVARLLGQLCEALQAAHTEGIVHRDLKPANLMVVDPDTPYEKMKVTDFGLAKLIDAPARPMHKVSDTGTDFAVGTPGYISPEQVRGDEMDHRSDLYSVGVILFELLTGRLPFAGSETMDVLLAHATEPPPSFAEVGASAWVSPAIETVVQGCLAKQPADRPANALELHERFEAALADEANGAETMPYPVYANGPHKEKEPPPPVVTPVPEIPDPGAVIHHLEAWMPESIATHKLRGFVHDVGGEVVESVPGTIRVRLGGKGSVYWSPGQGPLAWLGLGRKASLIDVELRLERNKPSQQSLLSITVMMRSPEGVTALTPTYRARCNQVFCDLRAYLMGQGGSVADAAR